jgi:hypothetical protein
MSATDKFETKDVYLLSEPGLPTMYSCDVYNLLLVGCNFLAAPNYSSDGDFNNS